MTTSDRIDALRALLEEAEAAHGAYETTELNGVYDQDWAAWYARYAVEHGISEVLGHPVATDVLAPFLVEAFAEFKQTETEPAVPWAGYIARRIQAEL